MTELSILLATAHFVDFWYSSLKSLEILSMPAVIFKPFT